MGLDSYLLRVQTHTPAPNKGWRFESDNYDLRWGQCKGIELPYAQVEVVINLPIAKAGIAGSVDPGSSPGWKGKTRRTQVLCFVLWDPMAAGRENLSLWGRAPRARGSGIGKGGWGTLAGWLVFYGREKKDIVMPVMNSPIAGAPHLRAAGICHRKGEGFTWWLITITGLFGIARRVGEVFGGGEGFKVVVGQRKKREGFGFPAGNTRIAARGWERVFFITLCREGFL